MCYRTTLAGPSVKPEDAAPQPPCLLPNIKAAAKQVWCWQRENGDSSSLPPTQPCHANATSVLQTQYIWRLKCTRALLSSCQATFLSKLKRNLANPFSRNGDHAPLQSARTSHTTLTHFDTVHKYTWYPQLIQWSWMNNTCQSYLGSQASKTQGSPPRFCQEGVRRQCKQIATENTIWHQHKSTKHQGGSAHGQLDALLLRQNCLPLFSRLVWLTNNRNVPNNVGKQLG